MGMAVIGDFLQNNDEEGGQSVSGYQLSFVISTLSTVTINPNEYSTSTNLRGGSRGPNLKPLGVISETSIGTD